jgi:NADPH-dependent curcumin reductase CurA
VNGIYDHRLALGQILPPGISYPFGFGFEAVGEIVAVGPAVQDFSIGDAVATVKFGNGYCEYQWAEQADVIRVPEISAQVLTLIPTGISALVALEQVADLSSGEVVEVSAAAGGLGHIVTQLVLKADNHVIALCGSREKAARLKALGCQRVINYKEESLDKVLSAEYPDGINLAFDTVGGEVFDTLLKHLAPRGRLVVSGFSSDARTLAPVTRPRIYADLYWKAASVRAFMNPLFKAYHADARERLLARYLAGDLDIWVDPDRFCGIDQVPAAVNSLIAGENMGKVVVKIHE